MSNRVVKHSKKPRGRKIPEADWNRHRDKILHLWLKDGDEGRTLEEIVDIMKRDCNFYATPDQYHNRIVKKWFKRKNISKNEWRKLYWDHCARKEAGTSTVVRFNERIISNDTKMREWDRYSFASERQPRDLSPLPDAFNFGPLDTTIPTYGLGHTTQTLTRPLNRFHFSGEIGTITTSPIRPSLVGVMPGAGLPFTLRMDTTQPFSWVAQLDWTNLTNAMGSDKQIVRAWKPDLIRLNASFYSRDLAPLTVTTVTDTHLVQHLVSCIINGTGFTHIQDVNAMCRWMTELPRQLVSTFFRALPIEITDVVCQRLRTAAVEDENADTVQALLDLEHSLHFRTCHTVEDVHSLLESLNVCRSDVAKIIVWYAVSISYDQDLILLEILNRRRARDNCLQLVQFPLRAGATPTMICFQLAGHGFSTLDELITLSQKDIFAWMQDGLLTEMTNYTAVRYMKGTKQLEWSLSRLEASISQRRAGGQWNDQDAAIASSLLSRALRVALERRSKWCAEAIYDTCRRLGFQAAQTDSQLDQEILQACRKRDWDEAIAIVSACPTKKSTNPAEAWEVSSELQEAISKDDLHHVEMLLTEHCECEAFEIALRSRSDNVAAFIVSRFRKKERCDAILKLLQCKKIRAVSKLLCLYSRFGYVLQNRNSTSSLDDLEDLLYRIRPRDSYNDSLLSGATLSGLPLQILLRMLSYHAIYQYDTDLLDWLLKQGLLIEGIQAVQDFGDQWFCVSPRLIEKLSCYMLGEKISLPSLVDVAIQERSLHLLKRFLSWRPTYKDSDALSCAIEEEADTAVFELLIQEEHIGVDVGTARYGSAALRIAICNKKYELVRLLVKFTDIHSLETVNEYGYDLDYLDALGESILQDDLTAVQILLSNGGNPNAIVVFSGLKGLGGCTRRSATYSLLLRMTALLLAVDIGNISMVRLLVENGAVFNQKPHMGLLRTPLQRAAEIGNFPIVQYFIARGATIDTVPVYGSGTALQLAAMSGHVGIARLLVEHGADVNHPPARGPGRMAFEAAAEWCRPDMMYFLIQCGAQLDVEVVKEVGEEHDIDDPEDTAHQWHTTQIIRTQYERAVRFAEARGEYASKRIVDSLYRTIRDNSETQSYRPQEYAQKDVSIEE